MARPRTLPEDAKRLKRPPLEQWFARNFQIARRALRLSLRDVGERINVDRGAVSRIELQRHYASLTMATDLALALGIDLPEMLVKPSEFKKRFK